VSIEESLAPFLACLLSFATVLCGETDLAEDVDQWHVE